MRKYQVIVTHVCAQGKLFNVAEELQGQPQRWEFGGIKSARNAFIAACCAAGMVVSPNDPFLNPSKGGFIFCSLRDSAARITIEIKSI